MTDILQLADMLINDYVESMGGQTTEDITRYFDLRERRTILIDQEDLKKVVDAQMFSSSQEERNKAIQAMIDKYWVD